MRIALTILWVVTFYAALGQQPVYTIESTHKSHRLNDHITYYIDSLEQDFDQVKEKYFNTEFNPSWYSKNNLSFWIKIVLRNQTESNQFIFTIDQWNLVTIYIEEDSVWNILHTGTSVPVDQRPISFHRLLSFPILLEPELSKTIYIRAKLTKPLYQYYAKQYSFHRKIEVDQADHAYKKYLGNQLFVLYILGIVSILIVYNLSLFILERQVTSIILGLYFIVLSLFLANIHGITTNYIFSAWSGFEMPMGLHLHHLISIIVSLFLLTFFKLNRKEWEFYLLISFIVFISLSWLGSFISNKSLLYFERRYVEYAVFLLVIITSIVRKKTGGKIILIAIVATILTGFFAEFTAVFFKNTTFTAPDFPYMIGILVQVLVFSVAATYRVRSLQQGMEKLEQKQKSLIQNQNIQLKLQVEEKTKQLQEALGVLQNQKNELEKVNIDLHEKAVELEQQAQSIKELNNKLEDLVVQRTYDLESTMRDLETFLYRASHDLRRPLMTILGLSNLISQEREVSKIGTLINHVNRTVVDLDKMLRKLIAISECYGKSILFEKVDLSYLLNKVLEEVKQEFKEKNFSIILNEETHLILTTNADLLKIMLYSLLENAILYGGNEAIITVSTKMVNGMLSISVHDTGVGIKPHLLDSIFEMFSRANEKSVGNGLGLYLVKMGTQKLNGNVKVKSFYGAGTEFVMRLPVE